MPNQMTFAEVDGYIVCYINGVEVSRAKKAADGTSTAEVIDIINDQIKANPTLEGTEPDLEGLEVSGDKYAVPSGGSSLMSDIVDANGNPRFVEGEGTPRERTGYNVSYCKWSLSGTHLMVVLAASVDANIYVGMDPMELAKYTLPNYILDKIYPVSSGSMGDVIETKSLTLYDANTLVNQTTSVRFKKEANGVGLYAANDLHATSKSYFRIQFDLLIDAS